MSRAVKDGALKAEAFDFEPKGEVHAKGFEDSIPIYRPIKREERGHHKSKDASVGTIGRDDELATFRKMVDDAAADPRGEMPRLGEMHALRAAYRFPEHAREDPVAFLCATGAGNSRPRAVE